MRVNWARRLQYLLFLPSGRESKVDCDSSDTSVVEFPSIEILKEDDPFRKVQEKSEQEKSEMNAKVIAEWQKGTLFGMSRHSIEEVRTLSLHFFPQIADFSSKSLLMTPVDVSKMFFPTENTIPSTSVPTSEMDYVKKLKSSSMSFEVVESEDGDDSDIIILSVKNKYCESSQAGKENQSCCTSMIQLHSTRSSGISSQKNMETFPISASTPFVGHSSEAIRSKIYSPPIMDYIPNLHRDVIFRMQVKAQIAHFNTICSIGESRDFATVLKDRLAYEKKALIDSMNKLELDIANSAMDSTLEKQFEELFLKTLEKIRCEVISRSDVSVWCESLHIYYPDCPEIVPLEGFLSLDEALRKKFQVEHAGTTRNVSDSFNQLPIEKNNDSLPSPVQLNKPKMVNNLEKLVNSSVHMDFSNNSAFSDLPKNDCLSMTVPRLKVRLQRDSTGNCSGAKVLSMKGEEEIEVCENLIEKREAIISASECAYYSYNANVYKGPGVIHANENITSSEVVSAKNAYYNQIEHSGVVERQKFRLEYKSKEGEIEKNKAQKGEIKKNEELRRLQDSKGKTLFNGKDPMDSHNETDKCAEPPFTTSKSTVPSTCDNSKSVDVISERVQQGVVTSSENSDILLKNINKTHHVVDHRNEGNKMRADLESASVSTINVDFGGCSCEVENIVEWKRTNEEQIITGQIVNDDLSEVMMDLDDNNDDDILCDHKGEEILNNISVEEAVLEGGVYKQTLVVNITEEDCIPSITETSKCKDVSDSTDGTINAQKASFSDENEATVITLCADSNIEDEDNNDNDEKDSNIADSNLRSTFSLSKNESLEFSDDEDPFICYTQALHGRNVLPIRADLSPVDDEDPFDVVASKTKSSSSEVIEFSDGDEIECIDSLDEQGVHSDSSSTFVPWKIIHLTLEKKNTKANYSIWNVPICNPAEISCELRQRVHLRNNNPLNIALATQTQCLDEVPLKRIRLADYESDPSTCILQDFEKYEAATTLLSKDGSRHRLLYDQLTTPIRFDLIKEKLIFCKLVREPKQYEQKVISADTQIKLNREPTLTNLEEELIKKHEIPEWGNVNPKRFEYPFSPTAGMYWPIIQPMDAVDVNEDKCVQLADVCNQLPCHTAYSFGTKSDLLCNLQPNRHRDRYNRTINMSFDQLKQCGRFRNRIGYQRKFTSQTIAEAREADSKQQKTEAAWIEKMLDTRVVKTREVDDEKEEVILQAENQCRSHFMEVHVDFNVTDKYSKKCDSQKGTREDLQVPRSWLEVPRHIYVSTNDRRGFLCTMVNFHNKTCLKLQPSGGEFSIDEVIKWQSNAISVIFLHQRGMLSYCNKGMLCDSDQSLANKRMEEIKRIVCGNRVTLADLDRVCRLEEWEKKYWPIIWDNLVSIFNLFPPVSQLQLQPYIDRAFITAAQLCDRAKFHERYQKFKNDAAAYNQC